MVKNCDDMLSRFHLIPERNGQTDERTDRFAISISRVSMLMRDEKWNQISCVFVVFIAVIVHRSTNRPTTMSVRTIKQLLVQMVPLCVWLSQQELSYRQQLARQLRTQYAEGIYRLKYYTVTLKSRLRVTQGHWKRNHWIDHTRLSSSRVI